MNTEFGILQSKSEMCHIVKWSGYDPDRISLSELFRKVYGKYIDINSPNDTDYFVNIVTNGFGWVDWIGKDSVMKLVDSGEFEAYDLRLMMTDLAARSIIPSGNYVVRVSW